MMKRLMMVATAIAAVAFGAPGAHAEPTGVDCGFDTVSQETVTGGQDTYTGVAYGYVVSAGLLNAVSVSCEVRVDGTTADATDYGSGTGGATTSGQVTYTASDTQDVDLCAVWTDGADSGEVCGETSNTQIPPQEVIDLVAVVFQLITETTAVVDPLVCPLLQGLAPGVPGVVDVYSDGDVYVGGGAVWDCPPYGEPGGGGDEIGPGVGAVLIQNVGGDPVVVTTRSVGCGPVENGNVTCEAKVGKLRCSSVSVTADHVPNLASTVTGTAECGTLTASATAGPTTPSDEETMLGAGRHPFECGMSVSGLPILPRVTCSYVTG